MRPSTRKQDPRARATGVGAAFALACAQAVAPAAAAGQAPSAVPALTRETFELSNGLRFIVHEDRSTPVVAVNVYYDVGSAHEAQGRSGFAHLFEHMLFEETQNLERGEIDRLLSGAGAQLNATTDTDRTMYWTVLPSNRLDLALWIEAERMARLRVEAENFAREREVVKEERRLRIENAPYGEAFLALDTLAADWPPYDHTVIGSMADLDAATAEEARRFHADFYHPGNATFVVAGDVAAADVRRLAETYFGEVPAGPELAPLPAMPPVPRTDGERRATLEDPLATLPLVLVGYGIPPHRSPETYALGLLSRIFAEGESSRLHRRLVDGEQAALQVFANLGSRMGPGVFSFGALANQGVEPARLEALMAEEVERLRTEGVTERELDKAKNQLRAELVRSRLTVLGKAAELQHARFAHGDVAAVDTDLDGYLAVTPEDVRTVARTFLVASNRTVVTAAPPRPAS